METLITIFIIAVVFCGICFLVAAALTISSFAPPNEEEPADEFFNKDDGHDSRFS